MSFSLAIKNGVITDGSGGSSFRANIYVEGRKIARITEEDLPAERTVDAGGLAVTPGFIDMHSHSDRGPWSYPRFEGRLHQGVTLEFAGNCGGSFLPRKYDPDSKIPVFNMKDAFFDLKNRAFGANFGTFIGHGELRTLCMKDPYAKIPAPDELEAMKALLDRELTDGAAGMSIGLEYMPGYNCETEELVELGKVVKKHGKLCPIHMRNESGRIFDSVDEVARIARESGVHMHISHLKIMFSDKWGRADELLEKIDAYRSEGLDISCDQYPYLATSTGFRIMMPGWSKEGTSAEITARIADDSEWNRMKDAVLSNGINGRGGPSCVVVASTHGKMKEVEGKSLEEISRILGLSPIDAFRALMIKCNSTVSGIFHAMNPEDTLKIMAREDIAVISDSTSRDFVTGTRDGVPHPRSTSSAVKFLRTVRENSLMPFEKAVYKLTGLPAAIMNVPERGLLREGYFADIVILDPATVADRGTFEEPYQTSVGIREVFVNGASAWKDGAPTGKLAGMAVTNAGRY